MFFSDGYLLYYILGIVLIPGILFGLWAQYKVTSTYKKYEKIATTQGITASMFARKLLDNGKLQSIKVVKINGELTDNYNPKTQTISLSENIYDSSSVSALGIAAHEVGHAFQKRDKYIPMILRNILVPITNFASKLLMPLIIIGFIFNVFILVGGTIGNIFILSGLIVFGLAIIFDLITLPVEFNASNRALKALKSMGDMSQEEISAAKQVLSAASLTYVAELIISILNFLRFILAIVVSKRR